MTKESIFNSIFSVGATVATYALGGWDTSLKILVALMVVDYVSGILKAMKLKQLNSDVMFWGGIRKASILVVVALSILLDQMMGNESPVFRTLAMWFYSGREGLSVVENLGILGVPLPSWLKGILEQLQEKGDKKDGTK
jgi:toxin secretion/phage lysis holin